jgi:uncharacterized protein (DUF427 family)
LSRRNDSGQVDRAGVGDDVAVTIEPLRRASVESVWDYPRPPIVVPTDEHVVIATGSVGVADTRGALRVLETSHPPVYYVPRSDIAPGLLSPVGGTTYCEFKGRASYFDLVCPSGRVLRRVAWHYPAPTPGFEGLVGYVAFYPGRVGLCTVDGEPVQAQEGDFYGGWVTSRVSGPFKGAAGTVAW